MEKTVVFGCGDVGRRIVSALVSAGDKPSDITGTVRSAESQRLCAELEIDVMRMNLDEPLDGANALDWDLKIVDQSNLFYTVAPQKHGVTDLRSEQLLRKLSSLNIKPKKAVVISTTGVYGDCQGEWVTELSPTEPQTGRGQRRLNLEQMWLAWGEREQVPVVILRVPGIYSFSRLPRERIARRTPVVRPQECGFSNRIHADDLALVCIVAMQKANAGEVFNATDGTPGKISEYLQMAAKALGQEPLPEISMRQAEQQLSEGMLSYLSESRKISNQKLLDHLHVELLYPDFRVGINH